ncbi:MAG: hypothetical protein CMJ88_06495, partial [Planctomycetes bacterium]|nr:hypothetical protein [Planctomycetota bacterium]
GAGEAGGRVVAAGAPRSLSTSSRTGRVLQRKASAPRTAPRRASRGDLVVRGASANSLRDLDLVIPVGHLTVVSGVSGSGKTSLVRGVVAASARARAPVGCRAVRGLDVFDEVVDDAAARALRSRQSCVATLLQVYDAVRKEYAATEDAKARGWRAAHFALQSKTGGACRACRGVGAVRTDLDFLGAAQWRRCEVCRGRRFDEETLSVRWLDRDLAQLLATSVDELLADLPSRGLARLRRTLEQAERLGLGYLKLGQSGDALSGGEAQRLRIAQHLATEVAGASLFLMDEPTRGLHPDDVAPLLVALESLLEKGHTILAVEHDLDVIAAADHVVDMGPGAGDEGGGVMFCGTPAALAACSASATGGALRSR